MVDGAEGVTDANIGNTGDGNDRANACFLDFNFIQTIKFIELADFYLGLFIGVMMVTDDNFLVYLDCAVVNLADTDTSYIFVVIDGADQYLGACIGISLGSGDIIDNGLKQGFHICAGSICIHRSNTRFG